MSHFDDPVLICDYDVRWQDQFNDIAATVRSALGNMVMRIEHIGSTSVPGLSAKPVVDLDVVVSRHDVPEAINRLAVIGYEHEGDLGIAERDAFRPPRSGSRHNLYLVPVDSVELRRHVKFRDALRANPDLCARYAALKKTLAGRSPKRSPCLHGRQISFIAQV